MNQERPNGVFLTRVSLKHAPDGFVHDIGAKHSAVGAMFPKTLINHPQGHWNIKTFDQWKVSYDIAPLVIDGRHAPDVLWIRSRTPPLAPSGPLRGCHADTRDAYPFVKNSIASLPTGSRIVVSLTAHPSRKTGSSALRQFIAYAPDQRAWLTRILDRDAGLQIAGHDDIKIVAPYDSPSQKPGEPEHVIYDVVHPETGQVKHQSFKIRRVAFRTVAYVLDAEALARAWTFGVGVKKSYGCGMISIEQYPQLY